MMETSKAGKRRRNSKVNKDSQKSEKMRKKQPRKMSPDSYYMKHSYHHRSKGRRTGLKRKRGHSKRSNSNHCPSRSSKRQSSCHGDRVENKRIVKKRCKDAIKRTVTRNKRHCRSTSVSSTSSDFSSSYSSQSCSTCSSYSSSSGSREKRHKKIQRCFKKSPSRSAYSKERKQRETNMEPEKKKSDVLKNGSDILGSGDPNGNLQRHNGKVSDCKNGCSLDVDKPSNKRHSKCSDVDYNLELDKPKKRQKKHDEESNRLSVHSESKKQFGLNDSYDDASLLGKPSSSIEKCKQEGLLSDDVKSKAEALELLLRQKALENLRKFRDCEFEVAEVPSHEKVGQTVSMMSREDDRVVFFGRCEDTTKCGKEDVKRKPGMTTLTDRVSNKHAEDSTRVCEQPLEASNEKVNSSVDLEKTTVIDRGSDNHPEYGRKDYEESREVSSEKEKNRAHLEMNLLRIKSSCHEETCTLSIPTSQRTGVSDLCTNYSACSGLKIDASGTYATESRRKLCEYEGNKSASIVDKDSKVGLVSLNKEHGGKSEMSGSEEPTAKKSDDYALATEFVSDKSGAKISELPLIKNENSQDGIINTNKESTEGTKPLTSQIEIIKSDDSTAKRSETSMFQQKTMSVMRGGEMVQISYKVYIPQRAVKLSRRQLQR